MGNTKDKPSAVFISDSPMTLGVQFILGHLYSQDLPEYCRLYGLLAGNHDSTQIEAPFTNSEKGCLIRWLKEMSPSIIGLSSIERSKPRFLGALPEIRREIPDAIYVAGGVDAFPSREYYFSRGIDLIVRGDGEMPVQELLTRLNSGTTKEGILAEPPPSCSTNQKTDFRSAETPQNLPLPYYGINLLALTGEGIFNYDQFRSSAHVQFLNRSNAIDMYTQRGCTHQCSFCAQDLLDSYRDNAKRNSRRRSLEEIVSHIKNVKQEYPEKTFLYFWDLDFLRRPNQELLKFASAYREKVGLPYFTFVTEKTVNHAGHSVLKALVDAGMSTINMGIQSGSKRVLHQEYGRFNTPEEALRAIDIIDKAARGSKLEVLYDVITYNPNESPAEISETIDLVGRIPFGDDKRIVRLSTHALSFNSGQALYPKNKPTFQDYQNFTARPEIFENTQSPWLSFLLGHLMRGELTSSRIGSVRRDKLPQLLSLDTVNFMDSNYPQIQALYKSFVPRDNEMFIGN